MKIIRVKLYTGLTLNIEHMTTKYLIRFNNKYPAEGKKWRVSKNNIETHYDEVRIECKAITTTDIVIENGIAKEKHHITCYANDASVINNAEKNILWLS